MIRYTPKSFGNINSIRRKINVINYSNSDDPYLVKYEKLGSTIKWTVIGSGLSYGPIGFASEKNSTFRFQNPKGDKIFIDKEKLEVCVDAKVAIGDLEHILLKSGLTLKVMPGAERATIGGCIAADVHGKNGHIFGSFGDHVINMVLLSSLNSKSMLIFPSDMPFKMTVGGFGATGAILSATLSIERAPGISMEVVSTRHTCPKSFLTKLIAMSANCDDIGGWFCYEDGLFKSKVFVANWSKRKVKKSLSVPKLAMRMIFYILGYGRWRRFFIRLLNRRIYSSNDVGVPKDPMKVLFPLTDLSGWQKIYGSSFVERQFLVPVNECLQVIQKVCVLLDKHNVNSLLNGVKLFRGSRVGKMSFANEGIAFSIQYSSHLSKFDEELTEYMNELGAPEYLAKVQQLSTSFPSGYPNYKNWLEHARKNNIKSVLIEWLRKTSGHLGS